MKKISKPVLLAGCVMIAFIGMWVIYLNRPLRINQQFAGFDRTGLVTLTPLYQLSVPDGYFYLAGVAGGKVYLGHDHNPTRLLAIGINTLDTSFRRFDTTPFAFKRLRTVVRDSIFYLLDGLQPFVRYGNTSNWQIKLLMNRAYFLSAEPVSSSGLVLLSMVNGENTLGRWHTGVTHVNWADGLLEKQLDGFFCSYGRLHTDQQGSRIVYVYRYRNEFLVTDTTLTLQYRGKTIDTISQVKIRVGRLNEETMTLASPPLSVNANSTLDGNLLYVHSNIMAANEDRSDFEQNIAIDVYDLDERGTYRYSFYIPKIPMKPFKGFLVKQKQLFALFGDELVGYGLSIPPKTRPTFFDSALGTVSIGGRLQWLH